jgi:hypothetical protein
MPVTVPTLPLMMTLPMLPMMTPQDSCTHRTDSR